MNTFLQIFNAFPSIIGAVQAVEAAIPLPQSGQQKMNMLLGAAGTAWEMSQVAQQLNPQVSKSSTLASVQALTNLTVAALNAAGVFGHSVPSATAAPPVATTAPATVASATA
jgi:hypothetical protein